MKRIRPPQTAKAAKAAGLDFVYFEIRPTDLLTRREGDTWWAYTVIEGPRGLRVEGLVARGATEAEALAAAQGKDWRNGCSIKFRALPKA